MVKPNGYWTIDNCEKEAIQYKTRYEYYLNAPGSHESARKNGWLDRICTHIPKRNIKWTEEKCEQFALNYDNMKELKKNNETVYKKLLMYRKNKELKTN